MKRLLIALFMSHIANAAWDDVATVHGGGWEQIEPTWIYNAGGGWKWFQDAGIWGYVFANSNASKWNELVADSLGAWEMLGYAWVYDAGGDWRWLPRPNLWMYLFNTQSEVQDVVPLVNIPAGSFYMGDTFNEGYDSEKPVHGVTLSAYNIGETEVTWSQWQEVREWAVKNGYSDLSDIGAGKSLEHPVYDVNWFDAVKWCNAASEKVGLDPVYYQMDGVSVFRTGDQLGLIDFTKNGYRLPTEAEWENAARGGLEAKRFAWGDTISHNEANYNSRRWEYSYDVNQYDGYHPRFEDGNFPYTSPVKSFPANGYGLYDVIGNVWEWCGDLYKRNYYSVSPDTDPVGPFNTTNFNVVIRGGAWTTFYHASYCRIAIRFSWNAYSKNTTIGFRIVRR